MSHTKTESPHNEARLSLRIPHQMVSRIDRLAAHCGKGRSEFVRTALILADTTMTLASLSRAAQPAAQQARQEMLLRRRLAEIEEVLSPKHLD